MGKPVILILLNYDNCNSSYLEPINTTCGRNMLKVTILASFFFLALALQHAESCSSSPETNEKKTSDDPVFCKDTGLDCNKPISKTKCPVKCKEKNENSKPKGKKNGGTTEANGGNTNVKNTTPTKTPNPKPATTQTN